MNPNDRPPKSWTEFKQKLLFWVTLTPTKDLDRLVNKLVEEWEEELKHIASGGKDETYP